MARILMVGSEARCGGLAQSMKGHGMQVSRAVDREGLDAVLEQVDCDVVLVVADGREGEGKALEWVERVRWHFPKGTQPLIFLGEGRLEAAQTAGADLVLSLGSERIVEAIGQFLYTDTSLADLSASMSIGRTDSELPLLSEEGVDSE